MKKEQREELLRSFINSQSYMSLDIAESLAGDDADLINGIILSNMLPPYDGLTEFVLNHFDKIKEEFIPNSLVVNGKLLDLLSDTTILRMKNWDLVREDILKHKDGLSLVKYKPGCMACIMTNTELMGYNYHDVFEYLSNEEILEKLDFISIEALSTGLGSIDSSIVDEVINRVGDKLHWDIVFKTFIGKDTFYKYKDRIEQLPEQTKWSVLSRHLDRVPYEYIDFTKVDFSEYVPYTKEIAEGVIKNIDKLSKIPTRLLLQYGWSYDEVLKYKDKLVMLPYGVVAGEFIDKFADIIDFSNVTVMYERKDVDKFKDRIDVDSLHFAWAKDIDIEIANCIESDQMWEILENEEIRPDLKKNILKAYIKANEPSLDECNRFKQAIEITPNNLPNQFSYDNKIQIDASKFNHSEAVRIVKEGFYEHCWLYNVSNEFIEKYYSLLISKPISKLQFYLSDDISKDNLLKTCYKYKGSTFKCFEDFTYEDLCNLYGKDNISFFLSQTSFYGSGFYTDVVLQYILDVHTGEYKERILSSIVQSYRNISKEMASKFVGDRKTIYTTFNNDCCCVDDVCRFKHDFPDVELIFSGCISSTTLDYINAGLGTLRISDSLYEYTKSFVDCIAKLDDDKISENDRLELRLLGYDKNK